MTCRMHFLSEDSFVTVAMEWIVAVGDKTGKVYCSNGYWKLVKVPRHWFKRSWPKHKKKLIQCYC